MVKPSPVPLLPAYLTQLHERFEDAFLIFPCNAGAGILDFDQQMAMVLFLVPSRMVTPPCWVNFRALPTRLINIWRKRASSPMM